MSDHGIDLFCRQLRDIVRLHPDRGLKVRVEDMMFPKGIGLGIDDFAGGGSSWKQRVDTKVDRIITR